MNFESRCQKSTIMIFECHIFQQRQLYIHKIIIYMYLLIIVTEKVEGLVCIMKSMDRVIHNCLIMMCCYILSR